MRHISLKIKLTVLVPVVMAMVVAGTFWVFCEILENRIKLQLADQQTTLVRAVAYDIDKELKNSSEKIISLARDLEGHGEISSSMWHKHVVKEQDMMKSFDNGLYLFSAKGVMLREFPMETGRVGNDFSFREYLQVTLKTGKPYISKPYQSSQTHGHPAIMFTAPIFSGGKVIAVTSGSIDLTSNNFMGGLTRSKIGKNGYFFMFTRDRTMILHPDNSRILKQDIPPGANKLLDDSLKGFEGTDETVNSRGVESLTTFIALKNKDWIIGANYPSSEAYASVTEMRKFVALSIIPLFTLVSIVNARLARRFLSPLFSLTRRVESFSDADSLKSVNAKGALDEISTLASAFEKMIMQLEERRDLLEEELRFSMLLMDSFPSPVFYKDADGRYIGCNQAFEKVVGMTREELIGKTVFDIAPLDKAKIYDRADRELLNSGGTQVYEASVCYADGSEHEVIFYKKAFSSKDGSVGGLLGTYLDITERRESEKALERHRDFSDRLIQSSAVPMFVLNTKHKVVIWNHACEELTGIISNEVIGTDSHWRGFYDSMRPCLADVVLDGSYEKLSEFKVIFGNSTLIPEGLRAEGWHKLRGQDRYIVFNAAPVRDAKGEMLAVIETMEDITDRKKIEEELRTLSYAITQSPVSIVITDSYGAIQHVNPKFTEVTGYGHAEVIGVQLSELTYVDPPTEEYAPLWETIFSGGEWRGEFHNRRKDGSMYWEEALISPIRGADGEIMHYVVIKEDVSERKRLEGQLRHSQKMEAVGQLAAGVAHDFNNILAAIVGYSSIMELKLGNDSKMKEVVKQILNASERGSKLTQGLLAVSRKQYDTFVAVDVNDIANRTLKMFKSDLPGKITLKASIDPSALMVIGDSMQIEQIIMNLLMNARGAMPDGGELAISTELFSMTQEYISDKGYGVPGEYALLTVRDSGIGMDEVDVKRIFEPFYSAKEVGGGSGLGLSITYGIVKRHKGFIICESTQGEGSCFKAYIPIYANTETAGTESI